MIPTGPIHPVLPLGYQQIVGLASATPLTVPNDALWCLIIPEGAGVRWRDDTVAPTASVGMPLLLGDKLYLFTRGQMSTVLFIQMTASAALNVSYYR